MQTLFHVSVREKCGFCHRLFVCFFFSQKTVKLRNTAPAPTKLNMEIITKPTTSKHDDFQFQSTFGERVKLVPTKEIVLKPDETYAVNILFAPTKMCGREALLRIRQIDINSRYTVSTVVT